MKRVLVFVALVGALLVGAAAPVGAKGPPPKDPPTITYVWGSRVAPDQIDVVVRVFNASPTQRITDNFWFYDANGVTIGTCGGFARLYSGAGSREWSSSPVAATPVPVAAVTMSVTATLADKRGNVLDVESGSAAVPALGQAVQFVP